MCACVCEHTFHICTMCMYLVTYYLVTYVHYNMHNVHVCTFSTMCMYLHSHVTDTYFHTLDIFIHTEYSLKPPLSTTLQKKKVRKTDDTVSLNSAHQCGGKDTEFGFGFTALGLRKLTWCRPMRMQNHLQTRRGKTNGGYWQEVSEVEGLGSSLVDDQPACVHSFEHRYKGGRKKKDIQMTHRDR
jgi:hypothetical protein